MIHPTQSYVLGTNVTVDTSEIQPDMLISSFIPLFTLGFIQNQQVVSAGFLINKNNMLGALMM